ncbi:glucuronyl hydrolase [Pelobium manganitolerans]|uniref:Glucuronyl hydrolase n=1 Tax=Pelobium manganitolerans TaxID=1842495 RepID=A0A419SC43_9SPHI|nr:glycoside hydrolase family 88 protein [Pelobium manganitolerans]RKD20395.1 glucuronyl hydrolase [Pelobium manganitolerans]
MIRLKKIALAALPLLVLLGACSSAKRQNVNKDGKSLSEAMAKTIMERFPFPIENNSRNLKWTYETGVYLTGISQVWKRTGNGEYFAYVQRCMDDFIEEDGSIKTYKFADYNLDNVRNGYNLLMLYKVTGKKKYYTAAQTLRKQLQEQPRTKGGSYWHKKIYPWQVWLDGLYMAMPFYTEWAADFDDYEAFNDIADQFTDIEKHARDEKTGLIYHGWDESKEQLWADKVTGNSPNFWGRAMGWYGMAMVDVLDYFPKDHPKRQEILDVLNRFAAGIKNAQDKKSGLWYQVMDKPDGKGNYLEASGSSMFVYTLAKAVRMGYIDASYDKVAQKGYDGIKKEFLVWDEQGNLHLNGTVSVAGLGGKPYRDGSYDYYLSEKVVQDDPKGAGAFMMAANEMELRDIPQTGKGKTVVLDNFFNNEFRNNILGKKESFHYVWNEWDNNGFGLFGEHFRYAGAKTETLKEGPTAQNLASANVYIIVDPDTKKETEYPNYMQAPYIQNIVEWVKNGGVLLLMANDSSNAELPHFNDLARQFGIQFKSELKNPVTGKQFDMGLIEIAAGNPVFPLGATTYLKEISTLDVKEPAKAVVNHNGDVVMATAKLGKGSVFAVGDPWLYNEYVDGRKLPAKFQNLKAAQQLIQWLLKQSK